MTLGLATGGKESGARMTTINSPLEWLAPRSQTFSSGVHDSSPASVRTPANSGCPQNGNRIVVFRVYNIGISLGVGMNPYVYEYMLI